MIDYNATFGEDDIHEYKDILSYEGLRDPYLKIFSEVEYLRIENPRFSHRRLKNSGPSPTSETIFFNGSMVFATEEEAVIFKLKFSHLYDEANFL